MLQTYYGEAHILQGVSLTVGAGEVVTLIGRNGAGKTTTLRSIMGLVPPRGGRITFDGRELTRLPTHEVARAGIAYVPEERRILPNLSVAENLRLGMLGARARHRGRATARWWRRCSSYFPRLRERYEQKGKSLSGGEQQMLAIARGLVARPKLMLVDEPTEGLSPLLVENLTEILARSTGAARPSCWSSRCSRWRSRSRTASTSSIRVASSSRAPRTPSAPTRRSSSAFWACSSGSRPDPSYSYVLDNPGASAENPATLRTLQRGRTP